MKTNYLIVLLALGLTFSACQSNDSTEENMENAIIESSEVSINDDYIVIFNSENETFKKSVATDLKSKRNEVIEFSQKVLKEANVKSEPNVAFGAAFKGMSIKLNTEEAVKLRNNPNVLGVYQDRIVTLARPGTDPVEQPDEVLPYGIIRTGYGTYTGSGKAWIIDTGIDLDHPDLNVNTSLAYLAEGIRATNGADDDNGHGSHCAGSAAAIDNEIGVVGVAAGAEVVPVKVLDKRGSGSYTSIIDGIDYVIANANPGDAANLSLGGGAYDPIDLAVQALGDAGVFVAMAAGNESDDANNHSPARANGANLYTVSAMDINDVFAYFSNYGNPPVDYCAPGVSVFSTYKGGSYATLSGTSMASPHVCGLLLLTNGNLTTDGYVLNDPDGNPDPIAHQ